MNLRPKLFFLILTIFCGALLLGCKDTTLHTNTSVPDTHYVSATIPDDRPIQRLVMTVEKGQSVWLSAEGTEVSEGEGLFLSDISSATVLLHGNEMSIQDSLQNGLLTLEEMFAYARIDSRNGYCVMNTDTKNGLTIFTFLYPDFGLEATYDIFQTPDGNETLIDEIKLFPRVGQRFHTFLFTDEETKLPIDQENWGLTFELLDATAHSATIRVQQSGGQQAGYLETVQFLVYGENLKEEQHGQFIEVEPEAITMNGTCQLTFDWTETLGEIPAGDYHIRVFFNDVYDPEEIHPLIRKFHDRQYYNIPFTVS